MSWKKQLISKEQLPILINTLKQMIEQGDERINQMRCVYTQKETSIWTMLMPYDFIDLDPKPEISVFYLYQVIE